MIQIQNIEKHFVQGKENITLLQNASYDFIPSKKVAIVGPSGSGKTTLLSIIAGFTPPSAGTVTIAQKNMYTMSMQEKQQFRQEYIGFIFQNFELLSSLTVLENVMIPLDITKKYSQKESQKKAIEMLEKVGMGHRLNSYPDTISGGEAQRVAVARALVHNPKYIFADEPTGNLDDTNSQKITMLLKEHISKDQMLLVITHDMRVAEQMDTMLTIRDKTLQMF